MGMGSSNEFSSTRGENMIHVSRILEELGIENYKLQGIPATEEEFLSSFVKITGSDEDGVAIESTDPADFGVTWAQIIAKNEEVEPVEPLRYLRAERNRLIAETDWWASSDLTMTAEQTAYRQALRDITDTYTSLDDVVWPTKPE